MRYLAVLLSVSTFAIPLAAQQPRWEYGRLAIREMMGVPAPVTWSAGDSSVNTSALIKLLEQHERAGAKRNTDPLIGMMNELDAQGWEFVQAVPVVGLIFRRQRQP